MRINLKNKEARLSWRYIPENSQAVQDTHCVIYKYELNGKNIAIGYKGTSSKPSFHVSFRTEEDRTRFINDWRGSIAKREDEKLARKLAKKNYVHNVKVGDIFDSSWGYEQTNVDFYQVIDVKGKHVVLRKICQRITEEYRDQGRCIPIKDSFVANAEPFKKLVSQGYNNTPIIRLNSYSHCSLWDGKPCYWSSGY